MTRSTVQKGALASAAIVVAVLLIGGYCLNAYFAEPDAESLSSPNSEREGESSVEVEPSAPPLIPTSEAELARNAEVQRKLDASISVDFMETPLEDALDDISEKTGVEFRFDSKLSEVLQDEPTTYTATLGWRGLSARNVLDTILTPHELRWIVHDGLVTIAHQLVTKTYDVTDRVAFEGLDSTDNAAALLDLIQETLDPESWDTWGGPGTAESYLMNRRVFLLIRQTEEVHRELDLLLAEIRRLDVPWEERPEPVASIEELARRETMNQPFPCDYDKTPLREFLDDVEAALERPVVLSSRAFAAYERGERYGRHTYADFGHVTLQSDSMTLGEALDTVLTPQELAYVYNDGVLRITDPDDRGPLSTRVYDATRLYDMELGGTQLVDLLMEMIEPYTWDSWGGPGTVYELYQRHGLFLVVRQIPEVHQMINRFLIDLELAAKTDPMISEKAWNAMRSEQAANTLREQSQSAVRYRTAMGQDERELLIPRVALQAAWDVSQEEIDQAADGINRFALDMYGRLVTTRQDENIFFAPGGISNALAMIYMGSSGRTESEMRQAMHFTVPPDRIGSVYAGLAVATESPHQIQGRMYGNGYSGGMWSVPTTIVPQFDSFEGFGNTPPNIDPLTDVDGSGFDGPHFFDTPRQPAPIPSPIRMANGLWIQQGREFQSDYRDDAVRYFGATTETLDFANDASGAAAEINAWCSEKTEGLIDQIVDEATLRPVQAYFANAIYYEAYWVAPFDRDASEESGTFYRFDGSEKTIPLMSKQMEMLGYCEHEGTQVVWLKYDHLDFSMMLMLPPEGEEAFGAFEASLSADAIQEIDESMSAKFVNLWMPRFQIETNIDDLSVQLRALGMESMFDPDTAEFPGILEGDAPFWLREGVHRAVLKVNDEETVAATATGMGGETASVEPKNSPPTVDMRIDRPFLLAIRHDPTGMIVFLARVLEPEAYTGEAS